MSKIKSTTTVLTSECIAKRTDSKIVVAEGKRKATFLNPSRDTFEVAKVDGCLIVNSIASDFVVSKLAAKSGEASVGHVVVELKGKDVDHAVEQISSTMTYWHKQGLISGRISGLVICAQYPRIDTKIQRLKSQLAARYKAPLHVISHNPELVFERVLDFKGPF